MDKHSWKAAAFSLYVYKTERIKYKRFEANGFS